MPRPVLVVAAMLVGRPETWQVPPKLWFSAAHVLLGIVGASVLISLVIRRLRTVERERSRMLSGVVHACGPAPSDPNTPPAAATHPEQPARRVQVGEI